MTNSQIDPKQVASIQSMLERAKKQPGLEEAMLAFQHWQELESQLQPYASIFNVQQQVTISASNSSVPVR